MHRVAVVGRLGGPTDARGAVAIAVLLKSPGDVALGVDIWEVADVSPPPHTGPVRSHRIKVARRLNGPNQLSIRTEKCTGTVTMRPGKAEGETGVTFIPKLMQHRPSVRAGRCHQAVDRRDSRGALDERSTAMIGSPQLRRARAQSGTSWPGLSLANALTHAHRARPG